MIDDIIKIVKQSDNPLTISEIQLELEKKGTFINKASLTRKMWRTIHYGLVAKYGERRDTSKNNLCWEFYFSRKGV